VALRVPGGLGSQVFMTFGTWRWWGRQPHSPSAFMPRNVTGTHFHKGLSRPQGHGAVGRKYVTEKSSDTTGNRTFNSIFHTRILLLDLIFFFLRVCTTASQNSLRWAASNKITFKITNFVWDIRPTSRCTSALLASAILWGVGL
jgi:hypothetical protein